MHVLATGVSTMKRAAFLLLPAMGLLFGPANCRAQEPLCEPGWWGVVIADPYTQMQIDHTDILLRPYRPFHVYGNTVRRLYYRGNPLPTIQDVTDSLEALFEGPTPFPEPVLHSEFTPAD